MLSVFTAGRVPGLETCYIVIGSNPARARDLNSVLFFKHCLLWLYMF